ncbi:MAG: MlaA family lipoprotein, partial [Candidatus Rokuibacteriota bacterium]
MPRILIGCLRTAAALLAATIAGVALAGCGSVSGAIEIESSLLTVPQDLASRVVPSDAAEPASGPGEPSDPAEPSPVVLLTGDGDGAAEILIAQAQTTVQDTSETGSVPGDEEDHDPWERFNEKMFEFNRQTDRFVLKPVAQVYT